MSKNKEAINMEPKVKISLRILPFGNIIYKTAGLRQSIQKKETKIPSYIEPLMTNIEMIEIRYEERKTYSMPKTTAGM